MNKAKYWTFVFNGSKLDIHYKRRVNRFIGKSHVSIMVVGYDNCMTGSRLMKGIIKFTKKVTYEYVKYMMLSADVWASSKKDIETTMTETECCFSNRVVYIKQTNNLWTVFERDNKNNRKIETTGKIGDMIDKYFYN